MFKNKKKNLQSDIKILSKAKKIALGIGIISSFVIGSNISKENTSLSKDEKNPSFDTLAKTVKEITSIKVAKADTNIVGHESYFGNSSERQSGYHYSMGTHTNHSQHASHSSHDSY